VISPQQVMAASPALRGGYRERALAYVYDNISNVLGNGTGGSIITTPHVLEDVSFVGGPWALPYSGARVISGVSWGLGVSSIPTGPTEQFSLIFWNPDDVLFGGFGGTGTSMIRPGAIPLGYASVSIGAQSPGFVYQFTLDGLAISVPPDANGVYVEAGWFSIPSVPPDWSTWHPDIQCPTAGTRLIAFGSNSLAGPGDNPATLGRTLPDYGRDILSGTCTPPVCSHAGVFIGGPLIDPVACNEHRGANAAVTQLGYQLRLQGDIATGAACNPDLNQDGNVDQGDVDYLLNVVAGAPNPTGIDPDFNQDGNVDQGDVDALLNVVAGGACPF
jgi:hypothetical protein